MCDVCKRYGIEVNRAGFAHCPFHSGDRTPSLKVYEGKRGFHCFGCGSHGGVIDFTMQFYNLDFKQAIVKLNKDFSLNLPLGSRLSLREKAEAAEQEKARRAAILLEKETLESAENAYHIALDKWIMLDKNKRKYAPNSNYLLSLREAAQLFHGRPIESLKPFHQKYVEALLKTDNAALELNLAEGRLRELERQRFDNYSRLDG